MLNFRKDNSASVNWVLSASLWILFGVLLGLTMAIQFVFPDFFRGIGPLVFSRVRQAHVNTVLFAFLSGAMQGLWLYIVPRLTGRKLWSEPLGNLCVVLWNLAVGAGIFGILYTLTQSREYAEMIWPVDIAVMVVLLLNMVNIYMTIHHRVERKLYVSLWYISGTVMWFPILYFIGNVMWNPPTGALTGINDTIFNWFYGHNVLGLWFTTGLLALFYYLIPIETNTPLYSHFLSLIAFWGIVLFYTGVGGHHLLWAPIPYWLKTIAVAESIGMILVVVAFMMNMFLTMRGNWNKFFTSIPLKFATVGWIAYVLVSYQGSHEAIRGINLLTHFTQYVPSHAHLSLLFFAASCVIAGTYYVIPRVFKVKLYSRQLANLQFLVYFVGFIFFFAGFVLAGLVQGAAWVHQGLPVWEVLPGLRPYMALRISGGALLVVSFFMFTFNVWATIVARKPVELPEMPVKTPLAMAPVGGE